MSTAERVASLDRALQTLERRLDSVHDDHARSELEAILQVTRDRRERLLAQSSLIEKALRPVPVRLTVARSYDNWVARVFRDSAFAVQTVPGDGSCLFHVLSLATGYRIRQLRAKVAAAATQEEFVTKKGLYESAVEELPRVQHRLNQTPPSSPYFDGLQQQLNNYSNDVHHYGWLKDVRTLDEYRAALITRGVWGDAEAVGHLEWQLQLKLLILCQEDSEQSGMPEIYWNTMIPTGLNPLHYVLVAYRRDMEHYDLITHGGRSRFSFVQLPFAVKQLYRQKCPQILALPDWQAPET